MNARPQPPPPKAAAAGSTPSTSTVASSSSPPSPVPPKAKVEQEDIPAVVGTFKLTTADMKKKAPRSFVICHTGGQKIFASANELLYALLYLVIFVSNMNNRNGDAG
jgi:hypothetical protein